MKNKKNYTGKKRKGFSGRIHSMTRRIQNIFGGIRKALTPNSIAWKSASVGVVIIILIFLLILAILYSDKLGFLISGLSILYFTVIGTIAALVFFLSLKFLSIIPNIYKWVLAGTVVILMFFWPATLTGKLLIIAITILSASFIAGTAGMLFSKSWEKKNPFNKIFIF